VFSTITRSRGGDAAGTPAHAAKGVGGEAQRVGRAVGVRWRRVVADP
jgi:hypothetical protein